LLTAELEVNIHPSAHYMLLKICRTSYLFRTVAGKSSIGGLDIQIWQKFHWFYSVSYFELGVKPTEVPPVATGLYLLRGFWNWNRILLNCHHFFKGVYFAELCNRLPLPA